MKIELMDHQKRVIPHLGNGKILYGGVGSGKTITALSYYVEHESPKELVVITTAKKRDSLDWEGEAVSFGVGTSEELTLHGVMTVDSWNNIGKYIDKEDCFFIFDEQRLVGYGAWSKAFIKIAKTNRWILLSATPGDTWLDYAPVFIANGCYKNITDFKRQHVLYEPYVKYPKVRGYLGEQKLERLRNDILVEMHYVKDTRRVLNWMDVDHNRELFKKVYKDRWHVYEDRPIKDVAELFRVMRRVVNEDPSRLELIVRLLKCHKRLVIFYNFNYELEILRTLHGEVTVAEWNGHKKQPIPETDNWVYLVQYNAGSEGWNCTETDAMVLYSMTYSYKSFEQAQGRIDRINTKFQTLYYYIFLSNSVIDLSIKKSLTSKKNFNQRKFVSELESGKIDEVFEWKKHAPEFPEGCQI